VENLWTILGEIPQRVGFVNDCEEIETRPRGAAHVDSWGWRGSTRLAIPIDLVVQRADSKAVMTTPINEARAIFDQAVEHTRGLSPATFDQWFGGVQFEDLTDGVLTLRAQNEFVLEWVRDNFLPTLTDKIRQLTGWSVEVAWMLDPHLESPVSKRTQIAPVRSCPRAMSPRP
jgi:hypothetical protein